MCLKGFLSIMIVDPPADKANLIDDIEIHSQVPEILILL